MPNQEQRENICASWGITETVAAYRLKEMRHLQAVEKLATWRRTRVYDRIADDDNQWASRPLPLTPEQFTASLWSELNALRDAISTPVRDGSWQRAKRFDDELKQGKVSLGDEEFAMIERFVERQSRDAAQVTVTLVSAVQYCISRLPTLEISSDVPVCTEENKEGMVDPERDQLEPLSASTSLETPGQQCPPNGETGRTIADGCLLVDVGSNFGGNTISLTESTTPPAASNTIFLQASHKPEDKAKGSEENKQFDPGGKGEDSPPWKAAVLVGLFFLGGERWPWVPALCAPCSSLCVSVCFVMFFTIR